MNNKLAKILSALLITAAASLSCVRTSRTITPLEFKPDTLPNSQIGQAYETEIQISQNDTPVLDFFISKGTLPDGLELAKVEGKDTAKIIGIPQAAGTFTFTISVRCNGTSVNGQAGEKEYSIRIEE